MGNPNSTKEISVELPALFTVISSKEIHGFDTIDQHNGSHAAESEVISGQRMENAANGFVSISMPQTPKTPKKVLLSENPKEVYAKVAPYDCPCETKSENKKVITIFGTMAMATLMSTILHPTASKIKHYTLPATLQSSLESLTNS